MQVKPLPLFGQYFRMLQHRPFKTGTLLSMVMFPNYRLGYDPLAPMTLQHSWALGNHLLPSMLST
jgi:hypothetical protein